jgi:hypothetical protein
MSGTGLVLLAALLVSCLALLMDTTSAGLERWCSSSSMHAASPKGRCGKELADAVDMLCRIQGQPLGRGKRAAIEAGN